MHSITKKLLKRPDLELIRQEIDKFLDDEKLKRQKFYNQINEKDKAEFINGKIILHSPEKKRHLDASFNLGSLIKLHINRYSLGWVGHEKIMVEFTRNSYEPDICFFNQDKAKHFAEDQLIFPIPDFIVEVLSKKTASIDRKIKFNDYASHGVGEYWIISPVKKFIKKYICKNFSYELEGCYYMGNKIASEVITGFEIDVDVIFDEQAYQRFTEQGKSTNCKTKQGNC